MYFYFILYLCFFICQSQENSIIQNITIEKYLEKRNTPHILIDVRTIEEYEQGYIDKAINININSDGFLEKVQEYNKETTLILYCRSGNRSGKAAKVLKQAGFKNIYNIIDEYEKWTQIQKK